jgi:hypothetical protein
VRMGGQNREKSLCICIWGPSKISSQASWLVVKEEVHGDGYGLGFWVKIIWVGMGLIIEQIAVGGERGKREGQPRGMMGRGARSTTIRQR